MLLSLDNTLHVLHQIIFRQFPNVALIIEFQLCDNHNVKSMLYILYNKYTVISYNHYNYKIVIHVPALTPFNQIGN